MDSVSAFTLIVSFLILSHPVRVLARPWDGPRPTAPGVQDPFGRSPKPTEPAVLPHNDFVRLPGDGLRKRVNGVQTCGYHDRHKYDPMVCSTGSVCATNDLHNVIDCLPREYIHYQPIPTSCIESKDLPVVCTSKACEMDAFMKFCSQKAWPYCFTDFYVFGGSVTRSLVDCADTSGVAPQTYYDRYEGSRGAFQISFDNDVNENTLSPGHTFYTPPKSQGQQSTSKPSSGSGVGKPASTDEGGTPVGAIAGGVVGGIVALVLLVGLTVYFCLRYRRKKNAEHQQLDLKSPGDMSQAVSAGTTLRNGSDAEEWSATSPVVPAPFGADTVVMKTTPDGRPYYEMPGQKPSAELSAEAPFVELSGVKPYHELPTSRS